MSSTRFLIIDPDTRRRDQLALLLGFIDYGEMVGCTAYSEWQDQVEAESTADLVLLGYADDDD